VDLSNLPCLQYGFINLMLFTLWTQHVYLVYSMGPSNTVYIIGLVNLRCMQYVPIQPFLQPDKHTPDTI
jgi:hypothetical protein